MLKGPAYRPHNNPRKLVIMLHGYGSCGDNLIPVAHEWFKELSDVEFFSPNAFEEFEFSQEGYQWFGVKDWKPFFIRSGLEKAAPKIALDVSMMLEERNLTPKDLVFMGFSQGAMLALEMMFHMPDLCAVMAFSGAFYPIPSYVAQTPPPKVLLVHGDMDFVVPYVAMLEAQKLLNRMGITPRTHTCMGLDHGLNYEAIKVGKDFLLDVLK